MIRDFENLAGLPPLRAFVLLAQARARIHFEDVALLATELETEIESEIVSDPDEQIQELYGELRALANEAPSASRDKRWRQLTKQLRALQEAEALRMQAYFEAHSPLVPGSGDAAIRRLDELLAAYGTLATPHRSSRETD
jgi:hypothetical protein